MSDVQNGVRDLHPRQALSFIIWTILVALVVVIVQSFQLVDAYKTIKQLSIMLSIAGAAIMLGALVGFLFGIPRKLQRESPTPIVSGASPPQDPPRPLYEGNTNLEQISDWLTKLIVGVTLVEFKNIVDQLKMFGIGVADATGQSGDNAFSIGIMIFFFVTGFLFGYLWTRLYLGRALSDAEVTQIAEKIDTLETRAQEVETRAQEVEVKMDKFAQQAQIDAEAMAFARRQVDRGSATTSTIEDAVMRFEKASSSALAQIFYVAENNRWANWRNDKSQLERSIILFEALVQIDVEKRYHQNLAKLAYCLKDKAVPELKRAFDLLSEAISIRGDANEEGWNIYEANRAIVRILLEQSGDSEFTPSPAQREAIVKDMEIALEDDWIPSWFIDDPVVSAWAHNNNYDLPTQDPP